MRKVEKRQILKNVGSSWSALAVNVLVGIFLWPFILHHLGDTAAGIWVLIFSITGYYGLFDLGIRSSIIRYVSKYTATGEQDNLTRFVNTSLFSYACVGAFSMVLTLLLSSYVERLFRIPSAMHRDARLLLLMVGASVSLGFPLGVFGGMLEGLQRFYILNWTSIGATLARAALIVYFLHHGYGLLTVALITVGLPIISSILRGFIVFRLCPVPLGPRYVDRASFRQMANYGSTTFLVIIAARLRFRTDELVLGGMMSAVAVTYFNIGARIVDYAQEFVSSLAQIFVPMASQSEATGNLDRIRKIYVLGNRVCAFLTFPITALLIIFGKSIIRIWVGARYVPFSYPVLVIMMLGFAMMLMQAASTRVLFGLGTHRTMAWVVTIEGIANLILSIALVALVPNFGVMGDCIGTAIPMAATYLLFMPRHLSKQIGVPVGRFVRDAYTLPSLLTVPFVLALLFANRLFVPQNLIQLILEVLLVGSVYGVGLFWAYRTNRAFHVGEIAGLGTSSLPKEEPLPAAIVEYQNEEV
ncbi:MAG TPA: oligosaccharide flippase family protein [Terriglobales bacterium]|nr:oligosaccharide flippase family protein [Terriglobales bacterium]